MITFHPIEGVSAMKSPLNSNPTKVHVTYLRERFNEIVNEYES